MKLLFTAELWIRYGIANILENAVFILNLFDSRWRVITAEDDKAFFAEKEAELCNGDDEMEPEETNEDHYAVLHDRALVDERKKFETFLKFPLTSRSRANRRIDSRGNESSGANTPIIVPTTPPPGEFEVSIGILGNFRRKTNIQYS